MLIEDFNVIVAEQLALCTDVLVQKGKEYSTEDKLHNFKVAAGVLGITPARALAAFMAKHTVSIYDMIRKGERVSIEVWNEKITDHINYLLLLKAMIIEDMAESEEQKDSTVAPIIQTRGAELLRTPDGFAIDWKTIDGQPSGAAVYILPEILIKLVEGFNENFDRIEGANNVGFRGQGNPQ